MAYFRSKSFFTNGYRHNWSLAKTWLNLGNKTHVFAEPREVRRQPDNSKDETYWSTDEWCVEMARPACAFYRTSNNSSEQHLLLFIPELITTHTQVISVQCSARWPWKSDPSCNSRQEYYKNSRLREHQSFCVMCELDSSFTTYFDTEFKWCHIWDNSNCWSKYTSEAQNVTRQNEKSVNLDSPLPWRHIHLSRQRLIIRIYRTNSKISHCILLQHVCTDRAH